MRYYMPLKSLAVFLFLSFCVQAVTAQNEEKLDTIYNPKVVYSAIPQKYEIAGITVTGAPNYEDYVLIKWTKAYGNKAWLEIQLKQQPRISEINYHGIKKSEREDLEMRLGLVKGNQITPNIVDRATTIIKKHFEEKGFKNAEVNIKQTDDLTHENEVIVDIYAVSYTHLTLPTKA